MPQIINETNWGAQLGEGLGKGIHEALDYLAYKKLNDLTESKQRRSAEGALTAKGYTPEEARSLSGLKGPELAAAIKTSPGRAATPEWINAQREAQGLAPLEGGSFGAGMNALNQGAPQQRGIMPASLQQQQAPAQKQQEAAAIFPQEQQQLLNAAKQFANPLAIQEAQLARTGAPSKPKPQEIKEAAKAIDEVVNKKPQQAEQNITAETPLKNLTTLDKYAGLTRKEIEEAIKNEAEERRYSFKETAKKREELLEEGRVAKETLRDLDRMEELNKEGKLDTPGYVELLKRSGLDIPALLNPESQEFQKIAQNFLRDAKTYYGGRVSNYEVEQFLKTIPSLSQTPEGRQRVIAGLKNIANAKKAYADTYLEIYKENKNKPPLDLNEQIYERIDKKLDKLAEKFREDIGKPVPEAQNRLLTAAQAAAGGAARIAGPALVGAGLGSIIPGIGTATGAGAGAIYGAASPLIEQLLGALGRPRE